MATLLDAKIARNKREAAKEDNRRITQAITVAVDYTDSPNVAGRPGYIWVQEYGQPGGVFQVYNRKVTRTVGLPVLVASDPKAPYQRQVLDADDSVIIHLSDYDGEAYLIDHGQDHEWPDNKPGPDVVNVYPRAYVSLRTYPISGLRVGVAYARYLYNNAIVTYDGTQNVDLTSHVPAAGLARYVLVYLDMATNAIAVSDGATTVDTQAIVPVPPTPALDTIPSALVRLAGGQTAVTEADIVDARMLLNPVVGNGHVIQDEGAPLVAEPNLNFVGAGVTVTNDAVNLATVVTIPPTTVTIDASEPATYWAGMLWLKIP